MPPEGLGVSFAPPGLFHRVREAIVAAAMVVVAGCAAPAPAPDVGRTSDAPIAANDRTAEAPSPIRFADGLIADRHAREVQVRAEVACTQGWLEQAVCRAGTREHESLLVIDVPPSLVHAALLAIGLEPGSPGRWVATASGGVERVPPHGDALEAWVRCDGRPDVPLDSWIHDPVHGREFPSQPWIFAGSALRSAAAGSGAPDVYVADRTGSVVGLVTFGDEPIAHRDVLSDKVDVDAPQWQARTIAIPEPGTAVMLVLRPVREVRK